MAEVEEYKIWLASGISNRALIEAIEILHDSFGGLWLAKTHENVLLKHEDGTDYAYLPGDFIIEPAETNETTDQGTQGVLSALDGLLYEKIMNMTPSERKKPMTVTHRVFFADNPITPLVLPPPVWTVLAIQADFDVITAELSVVPLRARAVGNFYTVANFPILQYV